jgi:YesN/AraC family two-component response regulator
MRPDCLTGKIDAEDAGELFSPFYNLKAAGCRAPVTSDEFDEIGKLFEKINAEQKGEGYKSVLISALYLSEILIILNRAYNERAQDAKNIQPSAVDKNVQRILLYINNNMKGGVTLEKLEGVFHLSKYYICHFFKLKTGFSVFEYLTHIKIATARKMLLESENTVTEIANTLRFCDASHFSRCFKAMAGVSPREFRKANRQAGFTE